VTCRHVLARAPDVWVTVGNGHSARELRCRRAPDADLMLLETDYSWPDYPPLVLGAFAAPDALQSVGLTSFGYEARTGGNRLNYVRFDTASVMNPQQRFTDYQSETVRLVRAEGLLHEGFSGGPLVIDAAVRSVIGVNVIGGHLAPMAGFIPADVVAAFLY